MRCIHHSILSFYGAIVTHFESELSYHSHTNCYTSECPNNWYGMDCSHRCREECGMMACHKTTGDCQACKEGQYGLPDCDQSKFEKFGTFAIEVKNAGKSFLSLLCPAIDLE